MKIISDAIWWTPAASVEELRRADHAMRADGRAYVGVNISWLATLVHNLAIAAFGALMFRAGDNFGFHMGEDSSQCTCQWSPGRGVPYQGPTRCESDNDDYDYSARSANLDDDEPELGCCPRNTWGDEFHDPGCTGGSHG